MFLESAIIERVETFVRHPVFQGSHEVMEDVLEDLQSKACAKQISQITYEKLCDLIVRSPHFSRRN